uniref:NADH-ubiquinone oxidoreductase chain 4L n=1 Tax=Morphostenophanes yunnanus TaxID=2823840 RepID=A0A8F3CIC1_9CUCU|nr:NADH dehydrogenase subunit 4L [Morphostenophanes yunnanus]
MMALKVAGIYMFLCGLLGFAMKRKHLLLMLLCMEFVVVSLYFLLFVYLSGLSSDFFFCMVFLTFTVCEGVLGLSVLVSLIRTHGNDYFQSFGVLW